MVDISVILNCLNKPLKNLFYHLELIDNIYPIPSIPNIRVILTTHIKYKLLNKIV